MFGITMKTTAAPAMPKKSATEAPAKPAEKKAAPPSQQDVFIKAMIAQHDRYQAALKEHPELARQQKVGMGDHSFWANPNTYRQMSNPGFWNDPDTYRGHGR